MRKSTDSDNRTMKRRSNVSCEQVEYNIEAEVYSRLHTTRFPLKIGEYAEVARSSC
jgi:hypothetical protein